MPETKLPSRRSGVGKFLQWLGEGERGRLLSEFVNFLSNAIQGLRTTQVETMTNSPVADSGTVQSTILASEEVQEEDRSGMKFERTVDERIVLGREFNEPAALVRGVCLRRKDRENFNVIAQVFDEKRGGLTGFREIHSKIVGQIKEEEVPEFERELSSKQVPVLRLSPIISRLQ